EFRRVLFRSVASDVRHLVLRRALPRGVRVGAWTGCAAILGLRILEETHAFGASLERVELLAASAWVLAAAALGAATASPGRGRAVRLSLGAPLLLLLAAEAGLHPHEARLVFVHAH